MPHIQHIAVAAKLHGVLGVCVRDGAGDAELRVRRCRLHPVAVPHIRLRQRLRQGGQHPRHRVHTSRGRHRRIAARLRPPVQAAEVSGLQIRRSHRGRADDQDSDASEPVADVREFQAGGGGQGMMCLNQIGKGMMCLNQIGKGMICLNQIEKY
jgi:hypothetical protein